jgi:hypothetical protein
LHGVVFHKNLIALTEIAATEQSIDGEQFTVVAEGKLLASPRLVTLIKRRAMILRLQSVILIKRAG